MAVDGDRAFAHRSDCGSGRTPPQPALPPSQSVRISATQKTPPEQSLMDIRNVAIIAHVDHGKTTLVDCLLKQSGTFRENQQVAERAMDSNDLERERGITILAKATSVVWKGTRVNIVDTPGHADFGGEVERILSMVDGVVLLVDAAEGPAAADQVRAGQGAAPSACARSCVINKVDRSDARPAPGARRGVRPVLRAWRPTTSSSISRPCSPAAPGRAGRATSLEAELRRTWSPLFDLIRAPRAGRRTSRPTSRSACW